MTRNGCQKDLETTPTVKSKKQHLQKFKPFQQKIQEGRCPAAHTLCLTDRWHLGSGMQKDPRNEHLATNMRQEKKHGGVQ